MTESVEVMKILVTGKNGFLARNFIEWFGRAYEILALSHDADTDELARACAVSDIVFHFAAVQRSQCEEDFYKGNVEYTRRLLGLLDGLVSPPSIVFTSSTDIDNPSVFATTKKMAESLVREYGRRNRVNVYVYKLNHCFGRYGKPDFNNVISTFCAHVAQGKPIVINDPGTVLRLTYVDDLMCDFSNNLERCWMDVPFDKVNMDAYLSPSIVYERSLGEIAKTLGDFLNGMEYHTGFERKLQITYQWFCGRAHS